MPMAKNNTKTVARLAMGTAILTIISGCENRVANSYSDLVSAPPIASDPLPPLTVETIPETARVAAPAVVVPEYVAPGAPTYAESSQAANVQTFESIYGAPVTDAASGALVSAEPYTPPSYDDGTVETQAIPAPAATVLAEAVTPSYTERTIAAIEPATFGVETTAVEGLVYGESLTSSSYTVAPEPVVPDTMATESLIEDVLMPEPVSLDTYTVETLPAATSGIMTPAPAEPPGFDTATPSTSYSYIDSLPLTDAAALSTAPMPVAPMPVVTALAPAPVSTAIETQPLLETTPFETASIASIPAPVTPSFNGVEIIDNNEALAMYSKDVPVAPSVGFEKELDSEPSVAASGFVVTPIEPILAETYTPAPPVVEVAALAPAVPEITVSPLPRPKQVAAVAAPAPAPVVVAPEVVAVPAAAQEHLAIAPLPRPRPTRAERVYATLDAPVPQPRPDYQKPMAVATTAGNYVSIGALQTLDAPKVVDDASMTAKGADSADMRKDAAEKTIEPVQEASIRTVAPKAPEMEKPVALDPDASELSGTSWRLVEVDEDAVSVNAELHFDGSSGFAGGQGPCNSYGGEFVNAARGNFSMDNIFSTEVACSSIEIEKRYLEALENATRYRIASDFSDMTLLDSKGSVIARFKAF